MAYGNDLHSRGCPNEKTTFFWPFRFCGIKGKGRAQSPPPRREGAPISLAPAPGASLAPTRAAWLPHRPLLTAATPPCRVPRRTVLSLAVAVRQHDRVSRLAAGRPSTPAMADSTKKNLPLLRAVKEGKREVITALLESEDVDVNFQNHCMHHRSGTSALSLTRPVPVPVTHTHTHGRARAIPLARLRGARAPARTAWGRRLPRASQRHLASLWPSPDTRRRSPSVPMQMATPR